MVHRKPLLDQWIAQAAQFLGIDTRAIGQIGAGKNRPNGLLDVAMVQSLVRKGSVSDLVAGYGQVIQDEAHHCPAVSFERVLTEVKAKYVVGLTTPQRRDGHDPILPMQLGPVRFAVGAKSQAARRPFEHKLVIRQTTFSAKSLPMGAGIQELYAALAADRHRNNLIFEDVVRALEEKRSPILLTERRDHLERLVERLRGWTRNLLVLHGGMKPKERRAVFEQLSSIPDGEQRLLVATGRYIGEGFDDARLDTLFLALPVSWKGTLIQYTGRLHRLHPGKSEVRIYDYVDHAVSMLMKMFEKRLRGYRAIGYATGDALPGARERREDSWRFEGARTMTSKKPAGEKRRVRGRASATARLDAMIEEATVDAYGEPEQMAGLFTMLEDNLATPFETEVLGVEVTVDRIEMTADEQIVAVCSRGKSQQYIPIVDLPLPSPPPAGAEWIAAFRLWFGRGR